MSEVPDFTNQETAEAWLADQPRHVATAVAARAALRVFPAVLADGVFKDPEQKLASTLSVLRNGLIAAAAAACPSHMDKDHERLSSLARSASTVGAATAQLAALEGSHPASAAASTAAYSTLTVSADQFFAKPAVSAIVFSTLAYSDKIFAQSDARLALSEVEECFNKPIWVDQDAANSHLERNWSSHVKSHRNDPIWDFWRRWYQSIWDGKPLDWELTRAVALIEDDVWQAGPEAVAKEIVRIEASWEVNRFKNDLANVRPDTLPSLGHNNPPTPLEEALEIIDKETKSPAPSIERLKAARQTLLVVAATCARWAGKKADRAVDKAIDNVMPLGITALLAANPQALERLVEVVERLIRAFGG